MFDYYKTTNYKTREQLVKWDDFEQKMVIFGAVWSETALKHVVQCLTRNSGREVPEWLTMDDFKNCFCGHS